MYLNISMQCRDETKLLQIKKVVALFRCKIFYATYTEFVCWFFHGDLFNDIKMSNSEISCCKKDLKLMHVLTISPCCHLLPLPN